MFSATDVGGPRYYHVKDKLIMDRASSYLSPVTPDPLHSGLGIHGHGFSMLINLQCPRHKEDTIASVFWI